MTLRIATCRPLPEPDVDEEPLLEALRAAPPVAGDPWAGVLGAASAALRPQAWLVQKTRAHRTREQPEHRGFRVALGKPQSLSSIGQAVGIRIDDARCEVLVRRQGRKENQ